ncbi:DUF2637 domain-containing protein [Streptomyces sp. NPDC087440]|uniref:DUF2637 domain-containing protein n=1 Tax=Streptomyces sp. NPDC087440 TaxID=3365790 RepID=UPI0038119432
MSRHTHKGGGPRLTGTSEVPPLSGWERFGATLVALGGAAVGALGFYASFDAVSDAAASWGFSDPWVVPTAIDSAIPVFTGAYLFLIRMGMPLAWARFVPWALSLISCALNVAAGDTLWSKVAHGAMSLLWVGVSEIAAHIYASRIGAVTGRRRMEKVRWSRWLLDPLSTFLLWRRMKVWELTSYDDVLNLEQDRVVYKAQLQTKFGRNWKRKAPVTALLPLRLASQGVPLTETGAAGLRAAGIEPLPRFIPLALPSPATPVPAAARLKPRAVTAAVPAQAATVADPPAAAVEPPAAGGAAAHSPELPKWKTQQELYAIIKWVLDNGHRELFDGPLTGISIANVLGQSEGNGRKVRTRLIKEYAAERGVDLPSRASTEEVFAAFREKTREPVPS